MSSPFCGAALFGRSQVLTALGSGHFSAWESLVFTLFCEASLQSVIRALKSLLNRVLICARNVEKVRMTTALAASVQMRCGEVDRRFARSKRALRMALIELATERGMDGFTVNDLCERADLNRGTFYNHFKGKDDLTLTLQQEFMDEIGRFRDRMQELTLVDLAKIKVTRRPLPVLVELFDYLREQSDLLGAMLGPTGDAKFCQQLRDGLCADLIRGLLHERYRRDPTPFVEYYIAFYSAAYLSVITRWLQTGMRESSEDMARIAMRLLLIKPGESLTV